MSKALQWIIGICAVLLVLAIVFSTVAPFFIPGQAYTGVNGYGYGMMGRGHMFGGGNMMGFGGFGGPLLGIGMLFFPLLLLGLTVLGIVWLVRAVSAPRAAAPLAPAATAPCAHCGYALQPGWKACPNCGEKV